MKKFFSLVASALALCLSLNAFGNPFVTPSASNIFGPNQNGIVTAPNSGNNVYGIHFTVSVPTLVYGLRYYVSAGDTTYHTAYLSVTNGGVAPDGAVQLMLPTTGWNYYSLSSPQLIFPGQDATVWVQFASGQTPYSKFTTGVAYPWTNGSVTAISGMHGGGSQPFTVDSIAYAIDIIAVPAFFGKYE